MAAPLLSFATPFLITAFVQCGRLPQKLSKEVQPEPNPRGLQQVARLTGRTQLWSRLATLYYADGDLIANVQLMTLNAFLLWSASDFLAA